MKAAARHYPVDVAMLPWSPVGPHGVLVRTLTATDGGGPATHTLRVPAGVTWDPSGDRALWQEVYVLEGAVEVDGVVLEEGCLVTRGPGSAVPAPRALRDAVLLEFQEIGRPGGDKEEVLLDRAAVDALPWERPEGSPPGLVHRVLSQGPSGSMTRVLRCDPFVATGVFVHDHAEEVLMLEGSYRMGDEFHPAGTYTAKGPGVAHGPFLTHEGYVGLEVRNYA